MLALFFRYMHNVYVMNGVAMKQIDVLKGRKDVIAHYGTLIAFRQAGWNMWKSASNNMLTARAYDPAIHY